MSKSLNPSLPRRDFLRGAAGLAGVAVLSGSGLAQAIGGGQRKVTLAYFDGAKLIPAETLAAGDPTLESVEITVEAYAGTGDLKSLNALFDVPDGHGGILTVPFHAWFAGGTTRIKFRAPTRGKGLTLRSEGVTTIIDHKLSLGTAAGAKLREGIYVIGPADLNLKGYRFEAGGVGGPLFSPGGGLTDIAYLVVTVQRA